MLDSFLISISAQSQQFLNDFLISTWLPNAPGLYSVPLYSASCRGKLLSRVSTRFHFILFFQHWLSVLDLILSLSPPSLNSSLLEPLMFLESESESPSVMSDSLPSRRLYSPWNSPGQNTRVGNLSLLQGIFLSQESNWSLLHCRRLLYQLFYQGRPMFLSQS